MDQDGITNSGCIDIPESLLPRNTNFEERLGGMTQASRALAMKLAAMALPPGAESPVATAIVESINTRGAVFRGRAGRFEFSLGLPSAKAVMASRSLTAQSGRSSGWRMSTAFVALGSGLALTGFAAITAVLVERAAESNAARLAAEAGATALRAENDRLAQTNKAIITTLEAYQTVYRPPPGLPNPPYPGPGNVASTPGGSPGPPGSTPAPVGPLPSTTLGFRPESDANCAKIKWPDGKEMANKRIVTTPAGTHAEWSGPAINTEISIPEDLRAEPIAVQWYAIAQLCAHQLHPLSPIWTEAAHVEATYCEGAEALVASGVVPSADELARIDKWLTRQGRGDLASHVRKCFGR